MMRAPEQMTRDEVNVGLVAACERLDGLRRQLAAAEERLRKIRELVGDDKELMESVKRRSLWRLAENRKEFLHDKQE